MNAQVMSAFTPDSQLDLLFPAELISQQVRDQLPAELHVRPAGSYARPPR